MPALPSAGILLYRNADGVEVLIAHMGGPFWARKDERAWSIPKGELEPGENALPAAKREFAEELGIPAPDVHYRELGTFRYSSGKTVTVFAAEAPGFELDGFAPGTFELEWPPRSWRLQRFAEVDRVEWYPWPTLVSSWSPARYRRSTRSRPVRR